MYVRSIANVSRTHSNHIMPRYPRLTSLLACQIKDGKRLLGPRRYQGLKKPSSPGLGATQRTRSCSLCGIGYYTSHISSSGIGDNLDHLPSIPLELLPHAQQSYYASIPPATIVACVRDKRWRAVTGTPDFYWDHGSMKPSSPIKEYVAWIRSFP